MTHRTMWSCLPVGTSLSIILDLLSYLLRVQVKITLDVFCTSWGFWLAPLLFLSSRTGPWADIFCKVCPVHVQSLIWSGNAWFRSTCCAMVEVVPSLWIPFSNSCSVLLAVYVIIPQLIFFQVFVSYTVLCPLQCQELILVSVFTSKSWCSLGNPRRIPASVTFVCFQWKGSSEKNLLNRVTNSIHKKTLNAYLLLHAFPLLIPFYSALFLTIMRKINKN